MKYKSKNRFFMILVSLSIVIILLSPQFLAVASTYIEHSKTLRMNKNLETYRRNIQDGFYNGIDLTIEKKNSILRKSAEIIGNALDAKVSSYGNAYIIETQNTVILLGHDCFSPFFPY